MVRRGWSRNVREIVVAKRELPGVREICGDVLLHELRLYSGGLASQPRGMLVIGVVRRRIGRARIRCSVGSWESAEIVVKAMVLFDDEHHVLDRRWHVLLLSIPSDIPTSIVTAR